MRPETGTMQFAPDWRGVFIRGDNAREFWVALSAVLPRVDLLLSEGCLESLAELLRSADETLPAEPQQATLTAGLEGFLGRAADRIAFAGHQLQNARKDLVEAAEALERFAPPRPWHYVTEQLPVAGTVQRFWLRTTEGPFPSRGRMGADGSYEATDGSGYHFSPAEAARRVYAWQPEPEPPPLPEAEHA